MKKLFAIVFAAAIILGALAAFSASADEVSDFQPFEGITVIRTERDFVNGLPKDTLPLDDATRLKIAEDYKTFYDYNCDPADCEVYYYKTLSNGMMLIFVEPEGIGYADVMGAEIIGKYVYVSTAAHKTVKLYKDGKFTEIGVAYKSGAIDDALLDEINEVMKFDTYTGTLIPATYDSPATPDIPYTGGGNTSGDNAGGFIATGDSGLLVTVCVAAMAAAIGAIVIFKRKGKYINK